MSALSQKLPANGPARESLRAKGQFWTPDWVAETMVAYVTAGGAEGIFDPAVGAGVFFNAAKKIAHEMGKHLALAGTEIDPVVLREARHSGLTEADLANVRVADFVLNPPEETFRAIVANPPYIRHHRLSAAVKEELRAFGFGLMGHTLDGRTGYHVYFLLRALQLLEEDGRLAFIMPADTSEGIYASRLWKWITKEFCLEAVVTFAPEASPFPQVDTNPMIYLMRNSPSRDSFYWARCVRSGTSDLKRWVASNFQAAGLHDLKVSQRSIREGLDTGLSRPPQFGDNGDFTLGDFATVLRGIATGANEFFFLTGSQADLLGITPEFIVPAIGRTRDVKGDELTSEDLRRLDAKGRPTCLLCPNGRPIAEFPEAVRDYLRRGEAQKLHERPLISTRKPWYKMELRAVPPILFAYLGRRNARFIRNRAGVVPLTGFLCVYPKRDDADHVERLWQVLRDPRIVENLSRVGKSYGDGAIKVEPRALERLPLPRDLVESVGLETTDSAAQGVLSIA